MDLLKMYKKSTLETALNEFGEKYHDFCNDHTCYSCPLSPCRGIIGDPQEWRKACKAYVIDNLTEANKKMDEVIAKAEEVKRKREEYVKKLLFAIRDGQRNLEYHAKRDADYVILNPGDYALLKGNTTERLTLHLSDCSNASYTTIYGMRIVCDTSTKHGEFVIGFKSDSHIKENGDE